MRGNARPGNIYNGVLKPTIGYGIRGASGTRARSNAGRAYQYRDLFPLMIKSWRDEWGQGDFPFYWVQLADFMAEKPEPGDSAWAELREAQTMTMDKLPNTGQAVIIDIGEGKDIHPKNKQDVAKRLARWALAKDYGIDGRLPEPDLQVDGEEGQQDRPHLRPRRRRPPAVRRQPSRAGSPSPVATRSSSRPRPRSSASDKVEVWSDEVAEPVAVRYAWADNPVCNLYSHDGLPATPVPHRRLAGRDREQQVKQCSCSLLPPGEGGGKPDESLLFDSRGRPLIRRFAAPSPRGEGRRIPTSRGDIPMLAPPYRAAVIGRTGRGDYGHGLDVAMLDQPKLQVVAVADEDAEGRAKAAKRLGVDQGL